MKLYRIPHTNLEVSRIGYGCAGLGMWDKSVPGRDTVSRAARLIGTAVDNGITLFDHADVYGYGSCETVFGGVLDESPGLRNQIVIQSKVGVHLSYPIEQAAGESPHFLDFSRAHLVSAVDKSLRRLRTDRLDLLLLHRPDALVEPEEVAQAFDDLERNGKVRYFGVSNHAAAQVELLKNVVRQPLIVNQLEFGLGQPYLVTEGLDVNRQGEGRMIAGHTGVAGLLDFCQLHGIHVQAYSPLRKVLRPGNDSQSTANRAYALLTSIAQRTNTTPGAVALAWVLRHPARIVPIIGSQKPEHIEANCAADRIDLSRQDWYGLLTAACGRTFF